MAKIRTARFERTLKRADAAISSRRTQGTFIQKSRAVSPKQKAEYHEELGAGRSHVKREFFSLNAQDEAAIVDRVDDALDRIARG